jgi:hypothetical protein
LHSVMFVADMTANNIAFSQKSFLLSSRRLIPDILI